METNTSDEQDLAKALDDVDSAVASIATPVMPTTTPSGLSFEETSAASSDPMFPASAPALHAPDDAPAPTITHITPITPPSDDSSAVDTTSQAVKSDDSHDDTDRKLDVSTDHPALNAALDAIKKDALGELRPLVDKLTVSPEEKFDTYLLLIRSTDDDSLIGPAHEAAKAIPDEARRAEALLDIIKEIDYLSQQKKD